MDFAIIANPKKYEVKEPIAQMMQWVDEHDAKIFYSKKLSELIEASPGHASLIQTETEQEAIDRADVGIAVGGDGTILYTAHLVRETNLPILGINSGRLGFMANTQQENLTYALQCLQEENYWLEKRFMLQAQDKHGQSYHALNEFLFSKKDTTSMVTINAEYNGMFINKYWSDGLIVASPTGSTAYNLSSEGPLVMPNSNVMTLTPVNSHTLTTRPLVLPSDKALKITVPEQQHEVLFSYDGQICDIKDYPLEVYIKRSNFSIALVELPNQNYFDTLRQKLMWGMDYRKRT